MAVKNFQCDCTSICMGLDWVQWSRLCADGSEELTVQQYLYGVWTECSSLCCVQMAVKNLQCNCSCIGFGLSMVTYAVCRWQRRTCSATVAVLGLDWVQWPTLCADGSEELTVQRGSASPVHHHQGVGRSVCCQREEQKPAPCPGPLCRAQQQQRSAREGWSQQEKYLLCILTLHTKHSKGDQQQQACHRRTETCAIP